MRGWRASMSGVGGMLAWVTWATCLHRWRASMGGMGALLVCMAWVACLRG